MSDSIRELEKTMKDFENMGGKFAMIGLFVLAYIGAGVLDRPLSTLALNPHRWYTLKRCDKS